MVKITEIKVLAILLFLALQVKSQTIYKSWYCQETHNLCLNINQNGYSSIDELEHVKFKIKGNKLKVIEYYNPRALIGGKNIYWFTIEKLTEDTLILSQIEKENQFEHMSGDTIKFIAIKEKCDYRKYIVTPK